MSTEGRSFWSGAAGRLVLVLLAIVALPAGAGFFLLHTLTHPPRDRSMINPEDLLLRTEEVVFEASDGVPLSGWFVRGAPGGPVILLCHDLGGSRMTMLNSAVSLNRAGYPLLVFDFRGHGQSGGKGGFLGVLEKNDLLGAIEYLKTRKDVDAGRLGVWGIGVGAYAAALAAAESPAIVALALDSLYPDVESELDRRARAEIPPAAHFVVPALRTLYNPYFGFKLSRTSKVSGLLDRLAEKSVLFIAAMDAPDRYAGGKSIYAALPDSPGGAKNFLELRASVVSGLYAEDKRKYDEAIVTFFRTYLPRDGRAQPPARPIQVIEK
jgi:pimeloyl-ACP methyl ester carboxylesterase